MAAVPPFYDDLGKASRDVFSKGFGELQKPFDVVDVLIDEPVIAFSKYKYIYHVLANDCLIFYCIIPRLYKTACSCKKKKMTIQAHIPNTRPFIATCRLLGV